MQPSNLDFRKSIIPSLSYRIAEVLSAREKGMAIDIVGNIKNSELGILDSWMTYFKNLKVPFIVTYDGTTYTLWKEIRL